MDGDMILSPLLQQLQWIWLWDFSKSIWIILLGSPIKAWRPWNLKVNKKEYYWFSCSNLKISQCVQMVFYRVTIIKYISQYRIRFPTVLISDKYEIMWIISKIEVCTWNGQYKKPWYKFAWNRITNTKSYRHNSRFSFPQWKFYSFSNKRQVHEIFLTRNFNPDKILHHWKGKHSQ